MKKIAALSLIAVLALAGCTTEQDVEETAAPSTTQTQDSDSNSTTEGNTSESESATETEDQNDEFAQGTFITGFGESDYNLADKESFLSVLEKTCDAATSKGVTERFGQARSVLFAEADGYNDYTAVYIDSDTSELIFSLDYFFACFISMEYAMFTESGETDLGQFPISVVAVEENVYQVRYAADPSAPYTSQYFFDREGLLTSVVSDPTEGDSFTVTINYGKPSDADFAKLKALVDAM